jgi:hypothetical protein
MRDTMTVKEIVEAVEDALLMWYENTCDEGAELDCDAKRYSDRLIFKVNKQTFEIKVNNITR